MSSVHTIILLTTVTLLTACSAVVTLGTASFRQAAIANTLGTRDSSGAGKMIIGVDRVLAKLGIKSALARRLAGAGFNWDPVTVLLLILGADSALFIVVRALIGNIGALILVVLFPLIFFRWLRTRALQRTERFISQLPELARLLANATSAGLSLERALVLAAREMPDPAASELSRVTAQIGLGWSLDAVLGQLSERMPSRELNVLVRTLLIQSRTGGGLVGALQDIALSLDERKELRREVRTVILGSAISGYIVPVLGIGSVVFLNLIEPGILDEMMRSFFGHIIIIPSVILFGIGALLMKAVSRVEV